MYLKISWFLKEKNCKKRGVKCNFGEGGKSKFSAGSPGLLRLGVWTAITVRSKYN